jgi:hypothetical protein
VAEDEVIEVLEKPGEDRVGRGLQDCVGPDSFWPVPAGHLCPDPEPDSVFVITSYELTGKPLAAYRGRRKKKRQ